ncbi:MAG: hypothetical protein K6F06_09745 [Bacteroidales bacterium]|nr:hypothetical protein [Bacteroidales bacterium]
MSKKKHLALKIILWSLLGLWVIAFIVIQIALSESFLTKTANRYAAEYVDGEVNFSSVRASVFKSFPNLNLTVDGFSVVGKDPPDTLATFDKMSLSVNYLEALRGRIRIKHAILDHPRVFLHKYDSTRASWDIIKFPSGEDDTSSFILPPISIGKVSLENSPYIEYKSVPDTLSAAVALEHLTLKNHRDNYDIDLKSSVAIETNSSGKIELPIGAEAVLVPDFERKVFTVNDLKASIAMMDFTAEGKVDLSRDSVYVKAGLSMFDEPVSEVTEYFGNNFPILKKLDTDAKVSIEADCDGYFVPENDRLPEISARVLVPDSKIAWEGIDEKGRFDLDGTATYKDGVLSAQVPDLTFKINGADIELKGSSEDLMCDDPLLKIDSKVHLVLDSLMRFLPDSLDISARGNLDGNIKGGFRLSQLDIYNFDKIGLRGGLYSDGIRVNAFDDTLSAFLGRASVTLEELKGNEDDGHVGLAATVDSLAAEYNSSTYFRGKKIRLTARNSEETIKGTKNRHPLTGRLDIAAIGMMDNDSCFVGVLESGNSFKLYQAPKNGKVTPYVNVYSDNKRIFVRESVNRYSLEGASLSVSASPVKAGEKKEEERRPKRDSLRRSLPDFLSEKDFEKKDIHISLGESVSKYIKEWNISGRLKVRDGKVITPYFPLDNTLAGLDGKFTNDNINLSGLTIRSGGSDVSATGTLSGLKRALTSKRSRLVLDLNLNSGVIDMNELLIAANAGSKFSKEQGNAALAEVNDNEYLESIKDNAVTDTATAGSLIVIPANLDAKVEIQAGAIKYSDLETSFVTSDLEMRQRCLQITNTIAMTNMGEVFMEGFYSTRTKKDIKAGFDLMLSNITAEKVIQLFPAVDSIVPMLKAFKGLLDCEMAATAAIDTSMNIVLPSLNGIVKVDGKNLSLSESEDLNKLRKTLMFKDRDSSYIDAMSARGIIKDNQLEVFPFILKVDRYTLALNGLQGFDQKFKYHVAAIKSPVPFKFGVNLGGTFSNWRWKLGKAKYRSVKIPLFDEEVDGARLNLVNSIHNIFDRGIEQAIKRNEEAQQAIEDKKTEISYSADLTEDLSEEEVKTIEKAAEEVETSGNESESSQKTE